jgi:hypothetical protein
MGADALSFAKQLASQRAAQQPTISNSSGGGASYSSGASSGSYKGGPGKYLIDVLQKAGFSPQAARIMYGIAGAESGYNANIQGDLGLQNNTWGPSYGMFQVRTLRKDTGTGRDRDINALRNNLMRQATAAYRISSGGRNFSPWTTYMHGSYRKFLPSFAQGIKKVPHNMIAQIHKDEMVVPAGAAEILRKVTNIHTTSDTINRGDASKKELMHAFRKRMSQVK